METRLDLRKGVACLKLKQIDGDYFALSVPPRSWWHRVRELVPEGTQFEDFFRDDEWEDFNFATYERTGVSLVIKGSSGKPPLEPTFAEIYFDKRTKTTPNLAKLGWRPMLLPMTKDGEPIYDSFGGLPNGAMLKGGSFLVNGMAMPPGGGYCEIGGTTVTIGDTNDETAPLEWILWDGALICNRLLGKMDISKFLQNDLI